MCVSVFVCACACVRSGKRTSEQRETESETQRDREKRKRNGENVENNDNNKADDETLDEPIGVRDWDTDRAIEPKRKAIGKTKRASNSTQKPIESESVKVLC